MRFYDQAHQYYCGVDLHARSMYLHILDADKRTVLDEDLPAEPAAFLDAVAPYRQGLVVGAECMFAWYWLADLCEDESIAFTLGHALYMKAIHGGKTSLLEAGGAGQELLGRRAGVVVPAADHGDGVLDGLHGPSANDWVLSPARPLQAAERQSSAAAAAL